MRPRQPGSALALALAAALVAAAAPSCLVDVPPIAEPGAGGAGGAGGTSSASSGGGGSTGANGNSGGAGGAGGCSLECPAGTRCEPVPDACVPNGPISSCDEAIDASQGGVFRAAGGLVCEGASLTGCGLTNSHGVLFDLGPDPAQQFHVVVDSPAAYMGTVKDATCTAYQDCWTNAGSGVDATIDGGQQIGVFASPPDCGLPVKVTITPLSSP